MIGFRAYKIPFGLTCCILPELHSKDEVML